MAVNVQKIVERMREEGYINTIRRYKYQVTAEETLDLMRAFGEARTTKFVIDKDNEWVYMQLAKWLIGDVTMQAQDPNTKKVIAGNLRAGIYIAGNTGRGKSWALDIAQMIARAFEIRIDFGEEKRWLYWVTARADQICDKYATSGDTQAYKKAGVLCIQDLGTEPNETLYMGNRLQPLRQVLEHRGDMDMSITLISSNYGLHHEALRQKYGDRVCSRLREMCNYLELQGKDRRLTNN